MNSGRWAFLLAVTLLLGVAAVWLFQAGPGLGGYSPGCLMRKATGLHCPGCGMTRASHALLHGDFAAAFRFNPLGIVLFPVALAISGLEAVAWARRKPWPVRLSPGPRGAWALVIAIGAFWLLRNLPWWPFTLLAPP